MDGGDGGYVVIIPYNQFGMIVSASAICFRGNENLNVLHLENPTERILLFKIKITHTDLFSIAPGKGTLGAHQKLPVTVKLNRLVDVTAKLLVSYVQLQEEDEKSTGSIDQQWAKIDKQRHQNTIIPISRTATKEEQEKKEERPTFKKTESPLYEMEIKPDQKQESNGNDSKKIEPILKKSLALKNSSSLFRSVEDLDKREAMLTRQESQRLEKELEQEREKNRRMSERLIEREKKIMYLMNMRQMEINRSVNRAEEEGDCNICTMLLGVMLLIMIGFFLSKYNLPVNLT